MKILQLDTRSQTMNTKSEQFYSIVSSYLLKFLFDTEDTTHNLYTEVNV